MDAAATEAELLEAFVEAVRTLDPDILVGYDVRKVPCNQTGYPSLHLLLFNLISCCLRSRGMQKPTQAWTFQTVVCASAAQGSFGYLIERAATLDVNLPRELSRTPEVPASGI